MDLGLLTVRPEIGADVTDLFNVLTGLSRQRAFRRLLVAPHSCARGFLGLVDRELAHAAAGRPARIVVKIECRRRHPGHRGALPGVDGRRRDRPHRPRRVLAAQPGVPGISENIRVRSIVGEFLEHSRIWGFENGGDREWYIGSADLMDRNLDRRVEAVVPVEDTEAASGSRRSSRSCWRTIDGRGSSSRTPRGCGPRSCSDGRARWTPSRASRSAPSSMASWRPPASAGSRLRLAGPRA